MADAARSVSLLEEADRRRTSKIHRYFPDCQPGCIADSPNKADHVGLCRALYPKHIAFFDAGATFRERMFLKGNRVGGTQAAAYEVTCHLTGNYPHWWKGRRFEHPGEWWCAGETATATRDIQQLELYGPPHAVQTGMIPAHLIEDRSMKSGVPDGIDMLWIRHVERHHGAPCISTAQFKCHPAGSRVLMGDGRWAAIESIPLGAVVRSPDGKARMVSQKHAYHHAPVIELRTRSGVVRATPNHRFFTMNAGWKEAGELRPKDVLQPIYHEHIGLEREDWLVCFTALMIGDGCMRGNSASFTCADRPMLDEIIAMAPPDLRVRAVKDKKGGITFRIASDTIGDHFSNRLRNSLRADGLWGLTSHEKFIPDWVFTLPRRQRVLFLRWLWGCDGSLTKADAYYSTVGDRLANDVRLLLWSVGIHAGVSEHVVSNQSRKKFRALYIALHGHNRLAFTEIGKLGRTVICTMKPRPNGPPGEILSVKETLSQDVFCIGVDGLHELIVEGYRSGNSYHEGRTGFQGTGKLGIWLDEEPGEGIPEECLLRTTTTGGIILYTFTPLQGLTPFVASFLETCVMANDRGELVPAKAEFWKQAT